MSSLRGRGVSAAWRVRTARAGVPGRTRTSDPRIRNPEAENVTDADGAACEVGAGDARGIGRSEQPEATLRDVPMDPDLALVADAWSALPSAVKAGIMAMVRASRGAG